MPIDLHAHYVPAELAECLRRRRSSPRIEALSGGIEHLHMPVGTLATVKIVELDDPAVSAAQKQARNKLIDGVFKEAGIALVRLRNPGSYTTPTLAAALGLQGSL